MPADTLSTIPPLAASAGASVADAAWIDLLLAGVGVYLLAGLVIGGLSLLGLAPRADPALGASNASVRLLLLAGAVAVWPLAARAWLRGARRDDRRNDEGAAS